MTAVLTIVGVLLLLLLWAFVIAPRRALKQFDWVKVQGWWDVGPEDAALAAAVQELRPFNPAAYVERDGRSAVATVVRALGQAAPGGGTRFLAQARTRGPTSDMDGVEISFETLILEPRPMAVAAPMYVLARDRKMFLSDDQLRALELRPTEAGLDSAFLSLFTVLEHAGEAPARVPAALRDAMMATADVFVMGMGRSRRWLPNACLRFTPSGWGFLVPMLTERAQMEALLETAERISQSLAAS